MLSVFGEIFHIVRVWSVLVFSFCGILIESIFGVHTLQEFQTTIRHCEERRGGEKPAIVILGSIPAGISVQLSFLSNLFIYHSDDEPQIELEYIRIFFGIGEFQVVFDRIYS